MRENTLFVMKADYPTFAIERYASSFGEALKYAMLEIADGCEDICIWSTTTGEVMVIYNPIEKYVADSVGVFL